MVRIIGAVMTGFACGYLGFRMSIALKTRLQSLSDICASLEMLESEINFSVNRLKKAFMRIDRNGLFRAAAEKIGEKGAKEALSEALNEMKGRLCITDADSEVLNMLANRIGKTDADDQIKNIRYAKTLLQSQEKQAADEYKRFGRLYRSGGVLVGVMVVIVLI